MRIGLSLSSRDGFQHAERVSVAPDPLFAPDGRRHERSSAYPGPLLCCTHVRESDLASKSFDRRFD
jgi:hypothetical protein